MDKIDTLKSLQSVTSGLNDVSSIAIAAKKSTVKISDGNPQVGWGSAREYVEYQKKDVSNWNNNDIRWYFRDSYFKRYGLRINVPIIDCHNDIQQVLFVFYKRLGYEPPKGIFKDFIDYYFERHADAELKSRGFVSFKNMSRGRFPLIFIDYAGLTAYTESKQFSPVETNAVEKVLKVEILTDVYRISTKVMLARFGVLIPVNFLMCCKGHGQEDAIQYVEKGLSRLSAVDTTTVLNMTLQWGPYPSWLRFLDFNKFGLAKVAIVPENSVFDCFKESK